MWNSLHKRPRLISFQLASYFTNTKLRDTERMSLLDFYIRCSPQKLIIYLEGYKLNLPAYDLCPESIYVDVDCGPVPSVEGG